MVHSNSGHGSLKSRSKSNEARTEDETSRETFKLETGTVTGDTYVYTDGGATSNSTGIPTIGIP